MLTWNKRGRQQSTIFWRNVGNPTAHKDLKGHKNLWLIKFSHMMMWHTHAHLVKHPLLFFHFTTHSASSFFLSFYLFSSSFLWSYISFHTLTKTSTTTATKNSNSRDKQYCFLKANTQRERERERERILWLLKPISIRTECWS